MKFAEFKDQWDPCPPAVDLIETFDMDDCAEIVEKLVELEQYAWAEWGLARLLSSKDRVEWACLCAESVLHIFEREFPDDKRPRLAIEAARNGSDTTAALAAALVAAWAAAWAAQAAAEAAGNVSLRRELIFKGLELYRTHARGE